MPHDIKKQVPLRVGSASGDEVQYVGQPIMAEILSGPSIVERLQQWMLNGPERLVSISREGNRFYVQVGSTETLDDEDAEDDGTTIFCDGSSESLAAAIEEAIEGAAKVDAP